MALISALKRYFGAGEAPPEPRVADLVREKRALLEYAIGHVPYELVDELEYQCRVVTQAFTATFTWDWRDQMISTQVRVPESRDYTPEAHFEHYAESWLKAQGLPARATRRGPRSTMLLHYELENLCGVVSRILADPRKTREALNYLAGGMEGYNDRAVCAEEAPPQIITEWTEARLRLRGGDVPTQPE